MVDRLIILDKCANGELTDFHTLSTALFDDMDILYKTLHPIVATLNVGAITFIRAKDGVSFILSTDTPIKKKSINPPSKVSVKTSGNTTTINIPISVK